MNKHLGFTLIEVLIALVIIAIALLAIEKVTADTIENTDYLWQKTNALWIADNAIAEIQCGLIQLPVANNQMTLLQQTWYWSASSNTILNGIAQITVTVQTAPGKNPLLSLTTYR